ncbi:MAG: S41 family peptidase [Alistipes indistinctus]
MKAKTKKGIKYTLLSALVALVGTVTIAASNPDFALGRNIQIPFNMFRELNLLYVDQIDPDEMLLDAADGMTSKLDPYTELIPEKEMADFEIATTGKYGGMGAMIRQKDDYVMIAQPYKKILRPTRPDSVVGDLLLEVNGESIKGYEVSKVSSMLKGTPGTTLHLKVSQTADRPGRRTGPSSGNGSSCRAFLIGALSTTASVTSYTKIFPKIAATISATLSCR